MVVGGTWLKLLQQMLRGRLCAVGVE